MLWVLDKELKGEIRH